MINYVDEKIVTSPSDLLEEQSSQPLVNFMLDLISPILDGSSKTYGGTNNKILHEVLSLLMNTQENSLVNHLAYKVAENFVQADMNIGDLVLSSNADRNVILSRLKASNHTLEVIQPLIENIHEYFDRFIYQAVTHFTNLKERNYQMKNNFIEETHIERLTLLGQMSSSFVHEFRNPLTTIIGFMKLLKNNQSKSEYIDIIQNELQQLSDRISQFLLLSKKGTVHMKKETFPLAFVIMELKELFYGKFLEENVSIEIDVDPNITLFASMEEIKQVILNILMNSVEALQNKRENRKISVHSYTTSEEFVVAVSNNGPMIPSGTLKNIFDPFYTKKEKGTGLGLFVCKQIIEASHGRIYCESDKTRTTFYISFLKNKHVTLQA